MNDKTLEPIDYSNYQEEPEENKLEQLGELVHLQQQASLLVAELEDNLSKAKAQLAELEEEKLPELMEDLGMELFKTQGGLVVELKENIRASIAEKNKPKAFHWLRENGNGDIIKNELKIALSAGEGEKAKELYDALVEQGYFPEQKQFIHPATLKSFVKEQLEEGVDLPLNEFGVFRQRIVKVRAS